MIQGFDNVRTILAKNKEHIPVKVLAEILAELDGEEAEVCEWTPKMNGEFIQSPHTGRVFSNEPSMQNVYCNTCGKPIKILEV